MYYLKNVATLAYQPELCIGCGRCAEVCPHGVFVIGEGKAAVIDRDACMECGACSRNCPAGALSVNAGVGCAAAVLSGFFRKTAPECGCSDNSPCCG